MAQASSRAVSPGSIENSSIHPPRSQPEALSWIDEAGPGQLPALFGLLERPAGCAPRVVFDALLRVAGACERPRGTIRRVLLGQVARGEARGAAAEALARLDGLGPAEAPARNEGATMRKKRATSKAKLAARKGKACEQAPDEDSDPYDDYYDDYGGYCDDYGPLLELSKLTNESPALNEVSAWVSRLHDELHREAPADASIRVIDSVSEGQMARLLEVVRRSAAGASSEVPPEARRLAERHGLALAPYDAVETLPALALRHALRRGGWSAAAQVSWAEISLLLREMLLVAPPGEGLEWRVLAFHEAVFEGPAALRDALCRASWHEGWLPLAPWLAAAEGLVSGAASHHLSGGSWLSLRCLLQCLARTERGLVALPEGVHAAPDQLRSILAVGGGAVASLDYPSFSVACRASLTEMTAEQLAEGKQIFEALRAVHGAALAPASGFASLLARCAPALWGELDGERRERLAGSLRRSALAYLWLRRSPDLASARLRRSHLIEFWRRPPPAGFEPALERCQRGFEPNRLVEAVVTALLAELHQPFFDDEGQQSRLKEALIEAARLASSVYEFSPYFNPYGEDAGTRLISELLQRFDHAPLELLQALCLDPRQGLPRLRGGQAGALEQRFRRLLREVQRGRGKGHGESTLVRCRPISKAQAFARGQLGRDCSSSSVPFRAASPHHVYYGLFTEQGEQLPGYMTVFEAWACLGDGGAVPVLCLETINEPRGYLAGVQQDLLVIFEAIARSRGLGPRLVLIRDIGTWNFANGFELARCRRARQGALVHLAPADPVVHRAYASVAAEARYYTPFAEQGPGLLRPSIGGHAMPMLAPFDPERDAVQRENLEEARRLAALPPRDLIFTCHDDHGPVGFISSWPRAAG